jgi:hypothetical protein
MNSKRALLALSRHLVAPCAALFSSCALAQAESASFASDRDSLVGDHVRLQTHVIGFKESGVANPQPRCAPSGSGVSIRRDVKGTFTVRFYDVPNVKQQDLEGTDLGKACRNAGLVSKDSSYTIPAEELMTYDFKRSGVTFGALVIPFKFRLGGDRAVTASSTVAPYLGFTSRYLQFFGLTLNPVATAGVAFVPVTNPATGKAETRPGFSLGGGLVLKSSKNDQFSAGLIVGRDVLSKSDRDLDPNVSKAWLSFYLGVAMR